MDRERHFGELRQVLETKGAKCKLQFTTHEQLYFEQECGFTDEELDVFRLRNKGYGVIEISFIMESKYSKCILGGQYGVGRVEARIRTIKRKMLKVLKDS